MSELTMRTGAGACCGSCIEMASDVLDTHCAKPAALPMVARAA